MGKAKHDLFQPMQQDFQEVLEQTAPQSQSPLEAEEAVICILKAG